MEKANKIETVNDTNPDLPPSLYVAIESILTEQAGKLNIADTMLPIAAVKKIVAIFQDPVIS